MIILIIIFLLTACCVLTFYFECLHTVWENYYADILEDFKYQTKHIPKIPLELPHVADTNKG
jgi:hypothetical protein